MDMNLIDIVNMVVAWGPTIIFLLIVSISFLYGICRGFRKSLILWIQALVAATICIVGFFVCTRSPEMDAQMLVIVNNFLGGETALQEMLSVSTECSTLKEVLVNYIPTVLEMGEGMTIVVEDNGQYLLTIVNLVFSMVFALAFAIIYYVLVFLFYLIYFFFYPERRHKRKIKRSKEKVYKKRRLLGGAVGTCRGLLTSLIFLSFLGSAFYTITGGTGEGKLKEHSFGDETYDMAYDIYRSIDSYGTTGIYKVLNTFKNKDDQPYYLFAADLVFSGQLEDENLQISENIKFREEVGAYVGFSKETANLLIKYGGDDINSMLTGESDSSMDVIVEVMENKEFQVEFEALIEEFDAKTYFINFAFSFVNSIINHIDDLEFAAEMDPNMIEIVKILFKEGHYSQYIPDERSQVNASKRSSSKETLPYLSVNKVLQKEDILTIFKVVTSMINSEALEGETEDQTTLRTIKEVLPYIHDLSIFTTARKDEMDPVLGRLYCFVENAYLTEEGQDGITYAEIKAENISWVGEINSLVDLAVDAIDLISNVYVADKEVLDIVVDLFDSSNANYTENMEILDSITATIEDSKLLGKVLSTSVMKSTLVTTMSEMVPNMYIDDKVSFVNTYDNSGNVAEYGELHQLFAGFKLIGKANNGQVLKSLVNSGDKELMDILDEVAVILEEKDAYNMTVTDYLLESKLLHSALSAIIINASTGDEALLYVTDSVLEENSRHEKVNLIKKEKLKEILDELPGIIDIIKDLDQDNLGISSITPVLKSEVFTRILNKNNPIIEGTIANLLINTLSEFDMIVLPKELETVENWFSTNEQPGEIKNIVNFVTETEVDFEEIIEGEDKFGALASLSSNDITNVLNSKIMHYTISNYISGLEMGDLRLIIPTSSQITLTNDSIDSLIKSEELEVLFNQLVGISFSTDMDNSKLMSELVSKFIESSGAMLESDIIVASVSYFLTSKNDILIIPAHLVEQGSLSKLENLTDDNLWHEELNKLIYSLDEMFNISGNPEGFTFDLTSFDDQASSLLNGLGEASIVDPSKKKIEIIYGSEILMNTISVKLDEALISDSLLTAQEASSAKESRQYPVSGGTFTFEFYGYNEILALSDCLYAFGITDMVGIDNNDLSSTVKEKLTSLNEDADTAKFGAGVSTIDLMYRSSILKILFSKELDKVLIDTIIEPSVLAYAKNNEKVYPQAQLENLVDAINALNITDMDNISGIEFNGVKASLQDNSKFDKIYGSTIIAGIISKKVLEITSSGSILTHHSKALESNVNIYKKQEIKCLVDLVGEFDINSMAMDNLKLEKSFISNFIYDNNGNTSSYLITATLSNNLLSRNEDTLVIPSYTIDKTNETIIKPSHLADLLNAIFALQESESISVSELDTTTQLTLPKPAAQAALLNSIIIRASMTNMIRKLNEPAPGEDSHMFVLESNIERTTDKDGNDIVIISISELKALLKVLSAIAAPGEPLTVPAFSYHNVVALELNVEDVYASDMTRITLVKSILGFSSFIISDKQEVVYDLWNKTTETMDSLSIEKINSFLTLFTNE